MSSGRASTNQTFFAGELEGNRSDTAHAPFRKGERTLAQYKFIHFGFKTNVRLLGWIPP